jgi:anti-sigma-K factor RskA
VDIKEIISSGIIELYVLGLTSEEENAEILRLAKQYPEVQAEIIAIKSAMEKFAEANAIEPNPSLKAKIFEKINGTSLIVNTPIIEPLTRPAPVYSISRSWKMIAAASIAILMVSAIFNFIYFNKYSKANTNLAETKKLLEKEQERNNELKNDWDIVRDPNNTLISLKGLETTPNATAKIFWFQQTGEVLIDASNLPETPEGMQYQFWGIVDGKPVNVGLIITSNKGIKYRMQKMKSFGKAEAFAISLEKAGGSTTPTVVVSMGKII